MSPLHTLSWWRGIGRITPTAYPRLRLAHLDRGDWRILATDDSGYTDQTGGQYATKVDAMIAVAYSPDLVDWRTPLPAGVRP